MSKESLSLVDLSKEGLWKPVRLILPAFNGNHRVSVNGTRAFMVRRLDNRLGEFVVLDLLKVRVTEVDGFTGDEKEAQIVHLKSSGNSIIETDDPKKFLAVKQREVWE